MTCLQGTDVQLRWLFVSLGWSIGKLFFLGGGGDYVVYLLFLKSVFWLYVGVTELNSFYYISFIHRLIPIYS